MILCCLYTLAVCTLDRLAALIWGGWDMNTIKYRLWCCSCNLAVCSRPGPPRGLRWWPGEKRCGRRWMSSWNYDVSVPAYSFTSQNQKTVWSPYSDPLVADHDRCVSGWFLIHSFLLFFFPLHPTAVYRRMIVNYICSICFSQISFSPKPRRSYQLCFIPVQYPALYATHFWNAKYFTR